MKRIKAEIFLDRYGPYESEGTSLNDLIYKAAILAKREIALEGIWRITICYYINDEEHEFVFHVVLSRQNEKLKVSIQF